MMLPFTNEELDTEMRIHMRPLEDLKETNHEWVLGSLSLSKFTTTWRAGWGHPLLVTSKWHAVPFTWLSTPMVALLFETGSTPPWYMAGWVHPMNAVAAEKWASFLNVEIADRLAGRASKYNGRIGLREDFLDEIYAYEAEVEDRRAAHIKPFVWPPEDKKDDKAP